MEQSVAGWLAGDWSDEKYRKRIQQANKLLGEHWIGLWDWAVDRLPKRCFLVWRMQDSDGRGMIEGGGSG